MPDGSQGLLAADHHHRRVRHRHPARLRLHAARRRRPARPQPHDEARGAARRRPHRRDQQRHVPAATSSPTRRGSSATCARSSRREQDTFLIGPMAKLGWGTPTLVSAVARRHHRDSAGNIAILGVLQGRAARPTTRRSSCSRSTSSARSSSTRSGSGSSPRCSTRASCSSRSTARWACSSRSGDDAELRAQRRRLPPALHAAAAAVPGARRASRSSILNDAVARDPRRGATSRSPPTPCSSARSAELFFGFERLQRRGPPRLRRAVPVLAVLLHRRDLGVALASRCSASACSASASAARSRGRRRGTSRARASISLLFCDIDVDFDDTWGESERHDAAADRGVADARGRARQARELAGAAAGGQQPAGLAAQAADDASDRWCCIRSARCASASARVPLDLSSTRSARRSPATPTASRSTSTRRRARRSAATRASAFAPAQFQDLDDAAKLLAAGVRAAGRRPRARASPARSCDRAARCARSCATRTIIIDTNFKRFAPSRFVDAASDVLFDALPAAAPRSPQSTLSQRAREAAHAVRRARSTVAGDALRGRVQRRQHRRSPRRDDVRQRGRGARVPATRRSPAIPRSPDGCT